MVAPGRVSIFAGATQASPTPQNPGYGTHGAPCTVMRSNGWQFLSLVL